MIDISVDISELFNIDDIPLSLLNKVYIDYEPLYDDMIDIHYLEESVVYESYNNGSNIFTTTDIINKIKDTYQLDDFQFKIANTNGVDFISVKKFFAEIPEYFSLKTVMLIPDINKNRYIIEQFMDDHGYFLAQIAAKQDRLGRHWFVMLFDPKKQESIKKQVLKTHTISFHTTPIANKESIEKYGIKAKTAYNPYKSNDKRIYLYLGNVNDPQYIQMMESISRKNMEHDKLFTGQFIEYKISLDLLPENIEFFIDIHGYGPSYVYVTSDIPYSTIIDSKIKQY